MITHTWGICANKNAFHNTLFVEKTKNRFLCTQLSKELFINIKNYNYGRFTDCRESSGYHR